MNSRIFFQSAVHDALLAMPFCWQKLFCIIRKFGLDF